MRARWRLAEGLRGGRQRFAGFVGSAHGRKEHCSSFSDSMTAVMPSGLESLRTDCAGQGAGQPVPTGVGGGGLEKLGGEQSTNLVILEAPANDKLVGLASVGVKHARI